ncbi:MAG: DUF1847 domain-containing protein [Thermoplasmata archaeon]
MECYEGKDCFGLAAEARKAYDEDERKSMKVSGEIEAEHYMKLTRLEEIMLYASMMGKRRMGIAFCIGLQNEARTLDRILTSRGFEVHSACCKICGIDKDELGVRKMHETAGSEALCNPIGQAMLLNGRETEINILVGLCVGHDMLFTEHSNAPVTTLVVKDRVLCHNPVGALYSSYYLETRFGLVDER